MRHEPTNGYLFVELLNETDGGFKMATKEDTAPREGKIVAPGDTGYAPGDIVLLRPQSWEEIQSPPWKGHLVHKDAVLARVKS